MKGRVPLLLAAAVICTSSVSALGKKDTDEKAVAKMDSWTEDFDLTGKKSGKYNIVVAAEDTGGNTTEAGPYNVFVDPDSDLPVCGITNPYQGMVTPSNLNVVGTCTDDDAVASVELVFDGDKEHPVTASGKDFWSYYLDTSRLAEGRHTISATGIDINGLRGKTRTAAWELNRTAPQTQLTSHTMGLLVSGKQKLSGTVQDGSGIRDLAYSIDHGKTFIPLKTSADKKTKAGTFSFTLDTKQLPDGPQILWFRAHDRLGTQGLYSFLLLVDNTVPEVKIVSPAKDEKVNGIFAVTGYAKDTVGISALSWSCGKQSGTLELIPGNPYFTFNCDIRGENTKSAEIIISASDTAGNTTKAVRKQDVDQEADKPSVTVFSPAQDSTGDGQFTLAGKASDDDGIAEVDYYFDSQTGNIQTLVSEGIFSDDLTAKYGKLSAGMHSVTVWAKDTNGIEGNRTTVKFTAEGDTPSFGTVTAGTQTYVPGMEIDPEAGTVIRTAASSGCGIQSVTWQFTGEDPQSVPLKNPVASVPLSIPMTEKRWGAAGLIITATDIYGRVSSSSLIFFLTNLGIPHGDSSAAAADASSNAESIVFETVGDQPYTPGMTVIAPAVLRVRIASETAPSVTCTIGTSSVKAKTVRADSGFTAEIPLGKLPAQLAEIKVNVAASKTAPAADAAAYVYIIRDKSTVAAVDDEAKIYWSPALKGRYETAQGGSVEGIANFPLPVSVDFSATTGASVRAALSLTAEGNRIKITPNAEGLYENVSVVVTDAEGKRHTSDPVTILADYTAPSVTFTAPDPQAWLQNKLTVSFTAHDEARLEKTEYAVYAAGTENPEWKTVPAGGKNSSARDISFSQTSALDAVEDGPVMISVRAADAAGRQTTSSRIVFKDTKAPEAKVIVPEDGSTINGETLVVMSVTDSGKLSGTSFVAAKGKEYPAENGIVTPVLVGTADQPLSDSMKFRFTDKSGNTSEKNSWNFRIDAESDLPVAEIHVPEENEVITKDFVISGIVYDDDGDCTVSYKLDNGQYVRLDGKGSSFAIPVPLASMTDNEHTVTVQAEDIHGVKGHEVVRKFRISLEEPKASFTSPAVDETVKDVVTITGKASDKNGIAKVELSFDNGNSYIAASGTENWSLTLDTHVIQDGTHCVFLRVSDSYGITAMYSSLVNIDNTAPALYLDLPRDGSGTSGMIFLSGQATDNIGLKKLYCRVRAIGNSSQTKEQDIPIENIISGSIDLSGMNNGIYNVEVSGEDAGGNITRISRNIELDKSFKDAKVRILYPMDGEQQNGTFNLYGKIDSEKKVSLITLLVDGKESGTAALSSAGYYKFSFTPETLSEGQHKIAVRADIDGSSPVTSRTQVISYSASGAWVTADNFTMGDFSFNRAYLKGQAGYTLSQTDLDTLADKKADKKLKEAVKAKTLETVELSFDNGKSFIPLGTSAKWKYRIEDSYMTEGYHFMVLRATMKNGEKALSRFIIQIDKTAPSIRLISPEEGGHYNQKLEFSGLASDDVRLSGVSLALRKGDKSLYSVPGFLQGAYLDVHFFGSTLFDVGAGLSFFDDNVKLQIQYGQLTDAQYAIVSSKPKRYGGNVFGAKLIANIYKLPFAGFAGPDWEWLSATFSVGADFSLFTETQSGKAQMLSAVLVQTEFPRATIAGWKVFRTWSLYEEFQLWFAPSDRNSDVIEIPTFIPEFCFGIRTYIF
jgi:hypothetical protein